MICICKVLYRYCTHTRDLSNPDDVFRTTADTAGRTTNSSKITEIMISDIKGKLYPEEIAGQTKALLHRLSSGKTLLDRHRDQQVVEWNCE